MEKLETELGLLKQRVVKLENIAAKEREDKRSRRVGLQDKKAGVQEFDLVEGWKIVDLKILSRVLDSAQQQCGHSDLGLVEVNRKSMRADLNSHLGFVCRTCGHQSVFSTSSFSKDDPTKFMVNREFSALGDAAFNSLVSLVQSDRTIKKFTGNKDFAANKPKFHYFDEDSDDDEDDKDETEDLVTDKDSAEEETDKEQTVTEPSMVNVKDEPADDFDNFMEPAVCLTEDDNDEAKNVNMDTLEGFAGLDSLLNPTIDVSTVTTNTPALSLATVSPGTMVMGGCVTPHPPDQIISTNPNMFIRTTCSKILLPPGIYSYQRNNGLHSIMSVKSDRGNFEDIEGHYRIIGRPDKDSKRRKTESKVNTAPSLHRKTSLQVFSAEMRDELLKDPAMAKMDLDNIIIEKWINLTPEMKKKYHDKAVGKPSSPESTPRTPSPTEKRKKKKTSMNIPLPALKRFAVKVAPELKAKSPHLALVENRGQLNKQILEQWVALSEEEKEGYKNMKEVVKNSKEDAKSTGHGHDRSRVETNKSSR